MKVGVIGAGNYVGLWTWIQGGCLVHETGKMN